MMGPLRPAALHAPDFFQARIDRFPEPLQGDQFCDRCVLLWPVRQGFQGSNTVGNGAHAEGMAGGKLFPAHHGRAFMDREARQSRRLRQMTLVDQAEARLIFQFGDGSFQFAAQAGVAHLLDEVVDFSHVIFVSRDKRKSLQGGRERSRE